MDMHDAAQQQKVVPCVIINELWHRWMRALAKRVPGAAVQGSLRELHPVHGNDIQTYNRRPFYVPVLRSCSAWSLRFQICSLCTAPCAQVAIARAQLD
jgi:hypothetical protein